MTRCAIEAASEPLAGSAPRARWWWLVEVPGAWGRDAVKECRVPAVRALASDDRRRIILIRRPGRHPATDERSALRVWIAGALPGDPPVRLAVARDPDEIRAWPLEGPTSATADPAGPLLAVCTNSSRDLCCGVDGRALVSALADEAGVWECSHLGGHRFAPTALHVPSGLVYGRLTESAARRVMSHGQDTASQDTESVACLRGRSSLEAVVQAAEIDFLTKGIQPDLVSPKVDMAVDEAVVCFTGLPAVRLRRVNGVQRPEQCGGDSVPARSWIVTADEVAQ